MRTPLLILVTSLTIAPALALDLPTRKAGLWEIGMAMEGGGMPAQSMQQCVDAASDKLMNGPGGGMQQQTCSKEEVKNAGGRITIDSVCQAGPVTTTSHSEITGDFNSAYTVKVSSTSSGGPAVPGMPAGGAMKMTVTAKWLGACKAGQRPGDIIMANGMTMNINDLRAMRGGGGAGGRPPGAGGMPPGAPARQPPQR